MAEKATIARPYARAAFEHAQQQQTLATWSQLLAVSAAVSAAPGAKALFGSPRVAAGALVDLITGIASECGVTVGADARNFIAVLAHGRRLALLPEIAALYEARRAEAENTLEVEVTTAIALTPTQRSTLERALIERFGRQVRLAERLDPALVGGAVVRAGDLVIDGSLRGRLARLEQQISRP